MEAFVKQTEISGINKAAILLCELGRGGSEEVLSCLNLSDVEKKHLRQAMERLGHYDPNNEGMVSREIRVLEEAIQFGKKKGILNYVKLKSKNDDAINQVQNLLKDNPNALANILGAWIDSDK